MEAYAKAVKELTKQDMLSSNDLYELLKVAALIKRNFVSGLYMPMRLAYAYTVAALLAHVIDAADHGLLTTSHVRDIYLATNGSGFSGIGAMGRNRDLKSINIVAENISDCYRGLKSNGTKTYAKCSDLLCIAADQH